MTVLRAMLLASLIGCPSPDEAVEEQLAEPFPRCAASDPLRQPFFGDTHVHTVLSLDANLQGTRLTPDDAYRFARGEEVGLQPYAQDGSSSRALQLSRPLDWVAVSDHAEFLGAVALCSSEGSAAYDEPACAAFRDRPDLAFITINGATSASPSAAVYPPLCGEGGVLCMEAGLDVWAEVREAAEAAYDRSEACTFTSFVAYEWSGGPDARNLHRNVIFRNEYVPDLPPSYFDTPFVPQLWQRLREDCLQKGLCDVLTIPHNSNLSAGLMFTTFEDEADPALSEGRRQFEPLVEIFQHKGDSECRPGTLASDEECGFEKLPYDRLSGANLDIEGEALPQDFVRDILGEGLRMADRDGVNPYLYGFVASTDTHLATPGAVEEEGYPGHGGAGQNNRDTLPPGLPDNVTFNPGGLAVLWAEENSREALFRAMQRREAYGTSGPRIVVRTFTGRGLSTDLCADTDQLPARGYAQGAPMGGVVEGGDGPLRVAVHALADPDGVGLDRVQVVKGWLEDGEARFSVVDVATAGGGPFDVDEATCQTSAPAAGELCAVWEDPDYDPAQPAFWYVRVLEQPTCRWSTLQCNAEGITCPTDQPEWASCCSDRVEHTLKERAWTSPVWNQPDGR